MNEENLKMRAKIIFIYMKNYVVINLIVVV